MPRSICRILAMPAEPAELCILPKTGFQVGRYVMHKGPKPNSGLPVRVWCVVAKGLVDGKESHIPAFVLQPDLPRFNLKHLGMQLDRWINRRSSGLPEWVPAMRDVRLRAQRADTLGAAVWTETRRVREEARSEIEAAPKDDEKAYRAVLRRLWVRSPWLFVFPEFHMSELWPADPLEEAPPSEAAWMAARDSFNNANFWPPGSGGNVPASLVDHDVLLYLYLRDRLGRDARATAEFVLAVKAQDQGSGGRSAVARRAFDEGAKQALDDARESLQSRADNWRADVSMEASPVLLPELEMPGWQLPASIPLDSSTASQWLVVWLRNQQVLRRLLGATGRSIRELEIGGARFPNLRNQFYLPFVLAQLDLKVGEPGFADLAKALKAPTTRDLPRRLARFVPVDAYRLLTDLAKIPDGPVRLQAELAESGPRRWSEAWADDAPDDPSPNDLEEQAQEDDP